MLRRNWLQLARKLVDQYDLDYTLNAIAAALDEAALSYWGEGVLNTTTYPNPFPITMSGSVLGGTVGSGIGYDPNGQLTRIDPSSPTSKNFLDAAASSTNPRWDVLCISFIQTGDTPVPKPSDPITTIDLNLHDDFVLTVVEGTPSPSPAYPAKLAGSIILAGIKVPANATLGTQCSVDYSIREMAVAGIVQNPVFVDERLTGTVDGTNRIFTISQLPNGNPLIRLDSGVQSVSDYSLIGQTVTFTVAPAVGQIPRGYYVAQNPSSQNPLSSVFETIGVGDGTTTHFNLSGLPANQASTLAILDSGVQDPSTDWSLLQTPTLATLIFNTAPALGQSVSAFFFVNAEAVGSNLVTGAANEGSGGGLVGLFDTKAGNTLEFKSLKQGSNMSIVDNGDGTVTLASSGSGASVETHGTASAPISVNPMIGIVPTGATFQTWWVTPTTVGASPVTASPSIAAGSVVGQRLRLKGVSSSNYLVIADGSGVSQNGVCNLDNNQSIEYSWDGVVWSEDFRRA